MENPEFKWFRALLVGEGGEMVEIGIRSDLVIQIILQRGGIIDDFPLLIHPDKKEIVRNMTIKKTFIEILQPEQSEE